MTEKTLKPKWEARFDYFEKEEKMTQEEKKEAYKKSPFSIKFNFLGFFFGPIYFFILGLWRKALVLIVIHIFLLIITGSVLICLIHYRVQILRLLMQFLMDSVQSTHLLQIKHTIYI
mgnify:CR=1 FL=1